MKFSEADDTWRSIPEWVSFLIEFGFAWLERRYDGRRIAVVSMPSDSAAAGLIALGAMRRCLELDDANDVGSHYHRLIGMAHAHTKGIYLRRTKTSGRYIFDGFDVSGNPIVKNLAVKWTQRRTITRSDAINWQIVGEAPVTVVNGEQVPNLQFYAQLVKNGGEIKPSNLSESHSQVCLAGHGLGETYTRRCMADIRFSHDEVEANLSQLLTVQSWMPGTISRVMFYNARTETFDRQVSRPQVVIADGDTSFLRVIDDNKFENSDVIGVIHRTMDRDRLEGVGTKLENLRQWYAPDESAFDSLPERPRGIGVSVLRRVQSCQ